MTALVRVRNEAASPLALARLGLLAVFRTEELAAAVLVGAERCELAGFTLLAVCAGHGLAVTVFQGATAVLDARLAGLAVVALGLALAQNGRAATFLGAGLGRLAVCIVGGCTHTVLDAAGALLLTRLARRTDGDARSAGLPGELTTPVGLAGSAAQAIVSQSDDAFARLERTAPFLLAVQFAFRSPVLLAAEQ